VFTSLASAEMVTRRWGTPPAGPPSAKATAPRAEPPTCYVVAAATPPRIDGKLDDEVWQKAQAYSLARTLDGAGTAAEPTEVRLLRDDQRLYLAFPLHGAAARQASGVAAEPRRRDLGGRLDRVLPRRRRRVLPFRRQRPGQHV
jgi:hypothetical protein